MTLHQNCKNAAYRIACNIISKMLKQPDFFYSHPFTLSKDAPAKFYLSTTSGSHFMISSVLPTRSSTSHAYLITKIGSGSRAQVRISLDGGTERNFPSSHVYFFTFLFDTKVYKIPRATAKRKIA